ncbi:hypothetical protein Tco_1359938 [Tanacetum coccineum]
MSLVLKAQVATFDEGTGSEKRCGYLSRIGLPRSQVGNESYYGQSIHSDPNRIIPTGCIRQLCDKSIANFSHIPLGNSGLLEEVQRVSCVRLNLRACPFPAGAILDPWKLRSDFQKLPKSCP